MKKRLMATLLVVLMCSVVLSACSALEGLEKDIQVSLNVNGEIVGTYTVNSFNNAVVDEPAAPSGKSFLGWSAHSDWESMDINEALLSKNKTLLRYAEIKDFAKDGNVTLYAVFGQIPRHDVAIAWYNKEATSGLNQSIMDNFTTALKDFLQGKGYNVDEMDIVVRAYDGNVGTSCGNIKADADIDIMVGWAARSNIEGTGGLIAGKDFLQNYGNITLSGAPKARYSAKLYDSDLVNTVYQWILTTYGGDGATKDYDVADTPDPTPDPDPTPTPDPNPDKITLTDYKLVVSVWNNSKNEWITTDQVAKLEADFAEYLKKAGVDTTKLQIEYRIETDVASVANLGAAVTKAGDVDFVLACGANVESKGGLTNLEKLQVAASPYMSAKRYIAVLNKDNPRQLATILYKFISGKDYPTTNPTPTPNPEPTSETIVVAWYNNTKSGLTQAIMDDFVTALKAHLTSQGKDLTKIDIVVRAYDGKVGESCAAIKAAGDVDIMVGWASTTNIVGTGGLTAGTDFLQNYGNITLAGSSKARYAARIADDELAKLVYNWILTTYGGTDGATKDYDVADNAEGGSK